MLFVLHVSLLAGVAFLAAGLGTWTRQAWWLELAAAVALFSLAFRILGWLDSRIGLAVDLAILAFGAGRCGRTGPGLWSSAHSRPACVEASC